MNEAYFAQLSCKVFTLPLKHHALLWQTLLSVLKEVIDQEPSYLSEFLKSPIAQSLMNVFTGSTEKKENILG